MRLKEKACVAEMAFEAEAADPMLPLKKKLRGLSYGDKGQDPRKLFSLYDKDNSGEL